MLLRFIVAVWSAGGRHTNADESKYVPKPGGAKAIDACFAFRFILKRRTKSVQNVQTCHFHPLPRGPHAHPQSLEFECVVELTTKFYSIKIGCNKIALVRRYKCSKTVPGKTWQDVLSVNKPSHRHQRRTFRMGPISADSGRSSAERCVSYTIRFNANADDSISIHRR